MDEIWQESPTRYSQCEYITKDGVFEIQDGRRPPFWKTLKTQYLRNCLSDFHQIWIGASSRRPRDDVLVKNGIFAKSKMAAGLQLKFTNMTITSKRLVRNGPNLEGITHSAPPMRIYHKKWNFWNPRWPPAAILENTKKSITPKPFVRLLRNLNWSFILAPRKRIWHQKWNSTKFKMAASHQWKFTIMAITSKRFVRNGPNLAGITHSISPLGKYEKST